MTNRMINSLPTISPPTTTPSPVDGLYNHIHLLPVCALVGVSIYTSSLMMALFTAPTYTSLSGCNMALGLTEPLTEISTTIVSWGEKTASV